jgi:hypothetical protein
MIFATRPGTVGSAGEAGTAGAGAKAAPPVDPVGVGVGGGADEDVVARPGWAPAFDAPAAGAPPSTANAQTAMVEAMLVTRKSFSFVGLRG